MTYKPHAYAMHSKTSEENIHATWYFQENLVIAVDLDVFLNFPSLPFHSSSKTPSMPHSSKSSPRKLYVSKSMRQRENKERVPKIN